MPVLLIPGATSIRIQKEFTPGGPTVLKQERRTQAGVLTISVSARA